MIREVSAIIIIVGLIIYIPAAFFSSDINHMIVGGSIACVGLVTLFFGMKKEGEIGT